MGQIEFPPGMAPAGHAELFATIIRADGIVEELGVIASTAKPARFPSSALEQNHGKAEV